MPQRILIRPIARSVAGVAISTMVSEKRLMTPKAVVIFYVEIATACYKSTGSKRVVCTVAAQGTDKL